MLASVSSLAGRSIVTIEGLREGLGKVMNWHVLWQIRTNYRRFNLNRNKCRR